MTTIVVLTIGAASGHGAGSTSASTVVSATIASSTVLDTDFCATGQVGRTILEIVQPGTGAVTAVNCNVTFGSSVNTATLRAYQPDGIGAALNTEATTSTDQSTNVSPITDIDFGTTGSGGVGWMTTGDPSNASRRLLKSSDGGATWGSVTSTPGGDVLAVDAVEGSTTVAWAARYQPVMRTTDGTTWTSTVSGLGGGQVHDIAAKSGCEAWVSGYDGAGPEPRIWYTAKGGDPAGTGCGGAGTDWTELTMPSGNPGQVYSVAWVTGTTVVAVGEGGYIWRATASTNFVQVKGSGVVMKHVASFGDAGAATQLIAVGDSGWSYWSNDAGATWTAATSPTRANLTKVATYADGTAIAVGLGGVLLTSTDYGHTWTIARQKSDHSGMKTAAIPAANTYLVAGGGRTAHYSTNSGSTWGVATIPWAGSTNWIDVDAWDGSRIIRVGMRGAIDTSSDGGATWTPRTSGVTYSLDSVEFFTRDLAIAVGSQGTLLRTTNGGANWTPIAIGGITDPLYDVGGTAEAMWVSGGAGRLLRSIDLGLNWSNVATGITDEIYGVDGWSATQAIIGTDVNDVRILTANGTWADVTLNTDTIWDIDIVPGTPTVWLVSEDDAYVSHDYGATWTMHDLSNLLFDIDAFSADEAWSGGPRQYLTHTTDGGSSWTTVTTPSLVRTIQGVAALGPDNVIAVGNGGTSIQLVIPQTIPDYTGTEWGTSSGLFAICLKSAAGAINTWPTTGSCPQADGTNWRAVPLNGGLAAAKVADTSAAGTVTASFRFGLFVPASQVSGTYRAPVTFEVVAPAG